MPYRRRTTRRTYRRTVTRRPIRRRAVTRMRRPRRFTRRQPNKISNNYQIGFPDYRSIRHRYVDSISLTSTVGAISTATWGMNCLFDTYLGVGGHQPMGFDQAMQFYTYGLVSGSKITCKFQSSDSAVNVPIKCGVYITEDTSLNYTAWNTMQEAGCKVATLLPASNRPVIAKGFFSNRKMFGFKGGEISSIANTVAQNPQFVGRAYVWVQSLDQTTTSDAVNVEISIDFLTKYTSRLSLAPS